MSYPREEQGEKGTGGGGRREYRTHLQLKGEKWGNKVGMERKEAVLKEKRRNLQEPCVRSILKIESYTEQSFKGL